METSDILSLIAIILSAIVFGFSIIKLIIDIRLRKKTNNVNLFNQKREILYYFSNLEKPQDKLSLYAGKNFILKDLKALFSCSLYEKFFRYINSKDNQNKYNDKEYQELLKEMENELEKSTK